MVVAPHPDDEAIAVGGSRALHRLAGSTVHIVFVTSDRPRKDGMVVRHGEADQASKVLGYAYEFLGVPDGRVSRSEELVAITTVTIRPRPQAPTSQLG